MPGRLIRGALVVALSIVAISFEERREAAFTHEAAGGAYRVRSQDGGLLVETREGGSIRFDHPRIVTSRTSWAPTATAATHEGESLSYDHGAWKEQYVLRSDALQQIFVLRDPIREEATIRIPTRFNGSPQLVDAHAVAFVDGKGRRQMVYRDAIAMDRAGHIRELPLSVEGNELAIRLPADYLASAVFPVLVDPLIGNPETLSPAGGLWRIPGVHIAWNSRDQYYLAVWHQDLVFNKPHSFGHPSHNWLNQSIVRARAIQVDPLGNVILGDPISPSKPYVGITLGPVTTDFAAFGPRVRYNPVTNEFLVVWAEGQWFLGSTFYDTSLYGDAVTDLDNNGIAEYAYCQEPYPSNSRIAGVRVKVDPAALHVIVGPPVEVTMAASGTPGSPSGTDTTAIHPCILPDVSWDGIQYIVTFQTLEVPVIGKIQDQSFGQYRHIFRAQSRVRYRLLDLNAAPTSTYTDLSDPKERFFVKGPTSDAANIVDGSVPTNLMEELAYDSVPTDPSPHVDSIVLPGADGQIGTADDQPLGSLLIWNVTSLTFNLGKSRVRGRFLPAGSQQANIVWDIFSSSDNSGASLPSQFVQRAYVAAGAANDAPSSHFLVAFESVEDVVHVGTPKVEFVGSLKMRMVDSAGGFPIGGVIDIATSNKATNTFYLNPSVTWCREAQQYFLAWSQTDTLWNPVTLGRGWYPTGWTFTDVQSALFGTIATAYPVSAACSYSTAIDPLNPDAANHHVMFAGQEDDFGANYIRRYKFVPVAGPGGGPPPSVSGGGGHHSHHGFCGVSSIGVPESAPRLLWIGLAAAALILARGRRRGPIGLPACRSGELK